MEITLSLNQVLIIVIAVGIIWLLARCIILLKNLNVTVNHTNNILADSEKMSRIAAERMEGFDNALDDVTSSINLVTESIKGNQSTVKAVTNLFNALMALKNLVKKKEK